MIYLLYYKDGFIKKFPLDKTSTTIGRSAENNLVIPEDFISRNHVKIVAFDDSIIVEDLGSTNGVNVNGEKVKKARIGVGESFILGKMEFFLKEGSLNEFKLAEELIPIFDTIGSENEKKFDNAVTRYLDDIFNETLRVVMQVGLKKNDFHEFLVELANYLSNLSDLGSLFIVAAPPEGEEAFNILLSVKHQGFRAGLLKEIVHGNPQLFSVPINGAEFRDSEATLFSYPLKSCTNGRAIIFLWEPRMQMNHSGIEAFLQKLAIEIDLLSQMLTGKEKQSPKTDEPQPEAEGDMVIESSCMKDLIQQAKKLARSEIFVLVEGESGSGKELFARLIHAHSGRNKKNFVAINCAAIPENLLESELFGHEKGAFTSAYAQKKGKLEVASGGTLVLDEIGDMPVNLQSKLLRALQEREFYRVGGTTPIKVDLRIISVTNRDLKKLISEGGFREDLYYRLVHRKLSIPPLRERKEDISALINFFTRRFCRESGKKIKGYSVKSFEALQEYRWQGNVRQLENEIRSIVNLTDDGETVDYDILSEEIKDWTDKEAKEQPTVPQNTGKMTFQSEKESVLNLLEKNRWNKAQTARDLKISYRGFFKKLKRLGIDLSGGTK